MVSKIKDKFKALNMKRKVHFLRSPIILVFALLFLASIAFAQGASWNLGKYSFVSSHSSGPLLETMSGPSSLRSYSFVGGVGGIAFGGVAIPDINIGLQKIKLSYDKQKPDGQRLRVHVAGKQYKMAIYDWMLIPIAKYANSVHNACVSLFGDKTTEKYYDIVYHPAFKDTLLGMRLLHADILLFDLNEMWKLPKLNGKTILGKGEIEPKMHDIQSALSIQNVLKRENFQSWVLTDEGVNVRIQLKNNQLQLTGDPYYYFWISDMSGFRYRRNKLIDKANKLRIAGNIFEHNNIVTEINNMEPNVSEVSVLIQGLQKNRDALLNFNPSVYNATATTMRYAALFRYVKKNNLNAWKTFFDNIRLFIIEPSVKTPTRWDMSH